MSNKQILNLFLSWPYWQLRIYLIIVAVCLFLGLLGQMPDSSAGWVLPIENPLGECQAKKATKGQRRRRWRVKMRLANLTRQSSLVARAYFDQTYLYFVAYTILLALFWHTFTANFMILALLPAFAFACQLFWISSPKYQGLPELILFKKALLTTSKILILLSIIALSGEFLYSLASDQHILLVAALQTAQNPDLESPSTQRRREPKSNKKKASRSISKRICLPINREQYDEIISDTGKFRELLDYYIEKLPELFPNDIKDGYKLHGKLPKSKKMPEVVLRRIKLKKKNEDQKAQVFTIAPSFVMPYMTGYSDSVEDALFLHSKFGVPYWALTEVFGRNDMYWYRLMKSFSRNSIVGTTIKHTDKLPKDILADEKHSKINGTKAYVATIAGNDCILGASISEKADTEGLVEAYGHFVSETNEIDSSYSVKSVNTDGWSATVCAWKELYPEVITVRCFLHAFIKIRSCAKKHANFEQLRQQVWEIYHQEDKESFLSKIKQLKEWALQNLSGSALDATLKLCGRADEYALAYDHPTCYRTSNMIDRHMEPMDRYLASGRYFHGHLQSAEERMRAWALMHNFLPYCPRSKASKQHISPAHKLNHFVYHDNWLENLLVSASMGGIPA